MPNIESIGNYEGVIDLVYDIDEEKLLVKAKVTTDDGKHGFPSAFLLNKDGGRNEEVLGYFQRLGWDGESLDGLVSVLRGKRVSFYSKQSGNYLNFYFSMKEAKPRKPVDKVSAQAKWDAIRGAARMNSKPPVRTPAPTAEGDLDIQESAIPF